jgi:hypothetical protein
MNKTAIVVISAHARFISAMPVRLLFCVFACYGPSAFYLAVVEQNTHEYNGAETMNQKPSSPEFCNHLVFSPSASKAPAATKSVDSLSNFKQ